MCLFYFAESCVMTKTSHPGCMRSASVSCPYGARRGPHELTATLARCFPGREEGPREGTGRVSPAHTLSCLLMRELHTCRKKPKLITTEENKGLFFFFVVFFLRVFAAAQQNPWRELGAGRAIVMFGGSLPSYQNQSVTWQPTKLYGR